MTKRCVILIFAIVCLTTTFAKKMWLFSFQTNARWVMMKVRSLVVFMCRTHQNVAAITLANNDIVNIYINVILMKLLECTDKTSLDNGVFL